MAKRDLVRLLVRLFGDPKLRDTLAQDAEKALRAAKLSAEERELILSGDDRAIQAYLGSDTVKANVVKSGLRMLANVVKTAVRRPTKATKKAKMAPRRPKKK